MNSAPLPAAAPELGVLLPARALGGHETALLGWLADAVQMHGLRPGIAAGSAPLAEACRAAGLGPHLLPAPPGTPDRASMLRWLARWPPATPLLLAPGVLHAQAWLLAAAAAMGLTLWVYVPMAYSARHMGYRHATLRDRLLGPWLQKVALWITVSAEQRRWLHQHWRLPAPVLVLPNMPRLAAHPLHLRPDSRQGGDSRLRVAWVGRFELWQKGLDWLAALLQTEPRWCRHYRWRFQGRGPGEATLQALASAAGPQHVLVHPHAPIAQALADSDVLLLPSRYEGLPLVALEATALGCPVVASRQAGLGQLLPPQNLFHFGDSAGLDGALARMQDPVQRAQAVAHAQRQLERLHSAQRLRAGLQALVLHLRAPQAAPGPAACRPADTGPHSRRAGP